MRIQGARVIFTIFLITGILIGGCLNTGNKEESGLENLYSVNVHQVNDKINFQVVFSDRSAHRGAASYRILDRAGKEVLGDDRVFLQSDFIDTGRCTQEYCGIEKMLEWELTDLDTEQSALTYELEIETKDLPKIRVQGAVESFNN